MTASDPRLWCIEYGCTNRATVSPTTDHGDLWCVIHDPANSKGEVPYRVQDPVTGMVGTVTGWFRLEDIHVHVRWDDSTCRLGEDALPYEEDHS